MCLVMDQDGENEKDCKLQRIGEDERRTDKRRTKKKKRRKKKNQDGGRFKQKKPNADDIPGYDFKEVNISSVRQCEHDGFPAYRLLINICTSVCTVIGLKMTGALTETHRLTCLKNAFLC